MTQMMKRVMKWVMTLAFPVLVRMNGRVHPRQWLLLCVQMTRSWRWDLL
jgi:hypothetical protein